MSSANWLFYQQHLQRKNAISMTEDTWELCLLNYIIVFLQLSQVLQSRKIKPYVWVLPKTQLASTSVQTVSLQPWTPLVVLYKSMPTCRFFGFQFVKSLSLLDWHVKGLWRGTTSSKHSPQPCFHLYVKSLERLLMRRAAWSCSISPLTLSVDWGEVSQHMDLYSLLTVYLVLLAALAKWLL